MQSNCLFRMPAVTLYIMTKRREREVEIEEKRSAYSSDIRRKL